MGGIFLLVNRLMPVLNRHPPKTPRLQRAKPAPLQLPVNSAGAKVTRLAPAFLVFPFYLVLTL
ncbi:hypothetical protein EFV60_15750 [Yersinia enterocolitica]|nr:hypothetical protein [Yersinia enterocolitica]